MCLFVRFLVRGQYWLMEENIPQDKWNEKELAVIKGIKRKVGQIHGSKGDATKKKGYSTVSIFQPMKVSN